MKTNEIFFLPKVEFFLKLNACKISKITVFDVIDEEVAVLP
jgi:hypothetical protein